MDIGFAIGKVSAKSHPDRRRELMSADQYRPRAHLRTARRRPLARWSSRARERMGPPPPRSFGPRAIVADPNCLDVRHPQPQSQDRQA